MFIVITWQSLILSHSLFLFRFKKWINCGWGCWSNNRRLKKNWMDGEKCRKRLCGKFFSNDVKFFHTFSEFLKYSLFIIFYVRVKMAQKQLSSVDFCLDEGHWLLEDDKRTGFFDHDDDVESNPEQDKLRYSEHDIESYQSYFDSDDDDSEEDVDDIPFSSNDSDQNGQPHRKHSEKGLSFGNWDSCITSAFHIGYWATSGHLSTCLIRYRFIFLGLAMAPGSLCSRGPNRKTSTVMY